MVKRLCFIIAMIVLVGFSSNSVQAKDQDCQVLGKLFNTEVNDQNGVCMVEILRKDLDVSHLGLKLSPETMELVFHLAFEKIDQHTAVMGELALLEEEVNPVIDVLREGNIEVSAIHNHMIGERPRVVYLHFQGLGDQTELAKIIKAAIGKTGHK
jgi:hypothetical protein